MNPPLLEHLHNFAAGKQKALSKEHLESMPSQGYVRIGAKFLDLLFAHFKKVAKDHASAPLVLYLTAMTPSKGAPSLGPCPYCRKEHSNDILVCPEENRVLPLEGRVLDRKFRFVKLLGQGGMGSVWMAQNILVQKHVAIKLMHPEFASNPGILARFRNEATAAGQIGNRHICDILDFGQGILGPYIVMEMLKGQSLADLIEKKGQLDPGYAVNIIRQALEGLHAAHEAGIIHRDLKPENIFLSEDSAGHMLVKLMDFGISKFAQADSQGGRTGVGVLMGTPEYMSPEQAEGAANVDQRTDIWAIGVILYKALSGREAFSGPTMAATLVALSTSTPEPLTTLVPSIAPPLVKIIERCIAKAPKDRFASAKELSEVLAPFGQASPAVSASLALSSAHFAAAPPSPAASYSGSPSQLQTPNQSSTLVVNQGNSFANVKPGSETVVNDFVGDVEDRRPPSALPRSGGKGKWILLVVLLVAGGGSVFAYQKWFTPPDQQDDPSTVVDTTAVAQADVKTEATGTPVANDTPTPQDSTSGGDQPKGTDGNQGSTSSSGDTKSTNAKTPAAETASTDAGKSTDSGGEESPAVTTENPESGDQPTETTTDSDSDSEEVEESEEGTQTPPQANKVPIPPPNVNNNLVLTANSSQSYLFVPKTSGQGSKVSFASAQAQCTKLRNQRFAGLRTWKLASSSGAKTFQKQIPKVRYWVRDKASKPGHAKTISAFSGNVTELSLRSRESNSYPLCIATAPRFKTVQP